MLNIESIVAILSMLTGLGIILGVGLYLFNRANGKYLPKD
jgi:hypothetical protein